MTDTSNWISAHAESYAECTLDRIFEELKQVVEQDVKEISRLPAERRRSYGFRFTPKGDKTFTVERFKDDGMATMPPGEEAPAGHVNFSIDPFAPNGPWILAKGFGVGVLFTVISAPEPESGRCGLEIQDLGTFEAWEVSRIALYPLFFGREYSP